MKKLIKVTKVGASGDTRKKPTAAPIMAKNGDSLELRKKPRRKNTRKVEKKGNGTACGCGGAKMKFKKGKTVSYQQGGVTGVTPAISPTAGVQMDALHVNQLKKPTTASMIPSAPQTIKDKVPPKPAGYGSNLLPGQKELQKRTVLSATNRLARKISLAKKPETQNNQQLNNISTPSNTNINNAI